MFGREAERARIEQLLDSAAEGPVGLALEGVPGIGKTTLWREAVDSARRRGYRVLVATPSEPDRTLAFAGLGDLLDGELDMAQAGLPDPQQSALAVALSLDGGSKAPPPDPLALPRAIRTVMRRMAARRPLVVAIDDEQWLDRASARVLAFALCRLRDDPVCVLLTRRLESDGALWPELARGFASGGFQTLTISALDLPALEALLRAQLARTIPRPVVRRIHMVSGGNPLYALAIARGLAPEQTGAGDIAVPASIVGALQQRLRGIDPRAHDAMLAIAAVSHPTLALLTALVPGFALSDLDSAVRAEVIEIAGDRVRFSHPLLASTHYSSVPAARRRELHRLAAEVLEDDEERARHLALGAESPDRRIAVALEQAADAAGRRGAPDVAALLLEDAARLTPLDIAEARRSRMVAAAEQHYASGDAARARDLLERLMPELPYGATRARALALLADTRPDDWAAAEALSQQALVEAGDNHRVRARIEIGISAMCSNLAKFSAMLVHADSAIASAELAGDTGLLAQALAERAAAACFNGLPVDWDALRRAIELEDVALATTYASPSGNAAQILFWSDDHERARPALERVIQRAQARGEEYDAGGMLFELAILEWYAGNRQTAELHRAEAKQTVSEQGEVSLDLWLSWGEALFTAGRGRLEEARVQAQAAMEMGERTGDLLIGMLPTIVLASVELWTGRPASAHELLRPVRESFVAAGFGYVGSLAVGLWSVDIEALIACERLEDAQLVLDDLIARARAVENPNAVAIAERCRGLVLAARRDTPTALKALQAALAEHARRPLAPEIARTLLELGTVQRRAKQKTKAKESLERALVMFESMGAEMWAARARDELDRIGLRRPSVSEGLTPAQARVAELVLAGMSNREIAGTLYMSQRSVEAHLTKVYREFGVRSRAQLVASMSAAQTAEGSEST